MQQYIPGAKSADNLGRATAATKQFEIVLEQEPDNERALALVASLCFNAQKLDEATMWYKKLALVKPDDKEAFYFLGVMAWTRSFQPIQEARQKVGMKPDDPGPIKNDEVRLALRVNYLPGSRQGTGN
jgi:thioredoxin-like negative regulator of GroEL